MQQTMQRVLATGEEQERLIEALLTLARSQRGLDRREPLDLAAVTGAAVSATEADAAERAVRVNASLGSAPSQGDRAARRAPGGQPGGQRRAAQRPGRLGGGGDGGHGRAAACFRSPTPAR